VVESTSDRWIKEIQVFVDRVFEDRVFEDRVFEDRVFEDRVINEGTSDEKMDEKISTFATNAIG
jgi:hypothetical protein